MTENQNEAVEAAMALALSDWSEDWEAYQWARIKLRPFQTGDDSAIQFAARILAAEVRRLREEKKGLQIAVDALIQKQFERQASKLLP